MRPTRNDSSSGRWIKTLEGYAAFHPHALPPEVDILGANPFLTPRGTERRLDVAYNTVMRAIEALVADGVLVKVGESKRDRVYCARAILEILEEPARLVPEPASPARRKSRG